MAEREEGRKEERKGRALCSLESEGWDMHGYTGCICGMWVCACVLVLYTVYVCA